jgi:hypothetical protein
MYRYVPVRDPFGALWVIVSTLLFAAACIAFSVWALNVTPKGDSGWLRILGSVGPFPAGVAILASIVAVMSRISHYRDGWEIVFDDQLTIHYPWPRPTRVFPWSEIARIEKIDEQTIIREPVLWVPLPVGAIVPGADVTLGLNFYEERTLSERKYRIIHSDGSRLTEFQGDNFRIGRWLDRKTLHDFVKALGGSITWNNDAPQLLSLRNSRLSAQQWEVLRERLANISGLEEIDLSGTELTDEALQGLEEFPSLRKVQTRGSRISSRAQAQLDAALKQRSARGKFDFLQA